MKKLYHTILLLSILGLAVSCSDELVPFSTATDSSAKDGFEFTLSFPEMENVSTRALGEGTAATRFEDLDIFLFVFDGSHLLQTIHIDKTDATRSIENGILKFKAYLPQTDNNAIIHIIAINDADGSFAAQINANGYGIEDTVMPALWVEGDKDSYWQRIDLETRILVTVDNQYNDLDKVVGTEADVEKKLKEPIPLIRNFAKITLENKAANFDVVGWTVVNDRDRGSAVPWYSKQGDPDILYPDYYDYANKKGRSYNELTQEGYVGVSQFGAKLRHTPAQLAVLPSSWNTDKAPKYIYERKISTTNPLYILVYGKFNNTEGYYKLSLGKTDITIDPDTKKATGTGLFTEYNVIRNIEYKIVIESVTAAGATTVAKAFEGPAYNNISGDVVTRNMINISDGADMLYVNKTSYVVTLPNQSWDFKFRYRQNIKSSTPTYKNELVHYLGLTQGDVIKSVAIGSQDVDGWTTITIEFNDPSDELKTQSFTIFSEPVYVNGVIPEANTVGLSRTINLVLRNKWEFVDMETVPGLWEDDTQWPNYTPDGDTPSAGDVNYFIGPEKGAPLTIFYKLPSGLPQAIFPLNFTFESDKQNIENAGEGTAVVQSGPSLFPNVYDHRISYVKTLTWEEYANSDDGESTPESRIQRARFVTTTAISPLPGASYITTVILHNDYFEDKTDKFERHEDKDVTDPTQ